MFTQVYKCFNWDIKHPFWHKTQGCHKLTKEFLTKNCCTAKWNLKLQIDKFTLVNDPTAARATTAQCARLPTHANCWSHKTKMCSRCLINLPKQVRDEPHKIKPIHTTRQISNSHNFPRLYAADKIFQRCYFTASWSVALCRCCSSVVRPYFSNIYGDFTGWRIVISSSGAKMVGLFCYSSSLSFDL